MRTYAEWHELVMSRAPRPDDLLVLTDDEMLDLGATIWAEFYNRHVPGICEEFPREPKDGDALFGRRIARATREVAECIP